MTRLPHSPHAVVTGAARGIGREIASQLTKAGVVVTALGRQSAALEELVAQGIAQFSATADVTATSSNGSTAGPVPLTFAQNPASPTGWVLTTQSLLTLSSAMG